MDDKQALARGIILAVAALGQIGLAIAFYNPGANTAIINLGWIILWISAIFGWLPIFTFHKKGGVPRGRSYIQTTILVDRGLYAIVRHPQYLAGMLMSLALPLISQHWLVVLPGIAVIIITYLDTYAEEKANLEKFGDAYRQYRERVPRLNFLLGIGRLVWRKVASRGKTQD